MIRIEVNTNNNGDCITSKCVEGQLQDVIAELVLLEASLIKDIVDPSKLKPGISAECAMLDLSDTVNRCVKDIIQPGGLITNETNTTTEEQELPEIIAEPAYKKPQCKACSCSTSENAVSTTICLNEDKLQQAQNRMKELVDKWYPLYVSSILSQKEHNEVRAEVHAAGFTMDDFIGKILDRVEEEAME